MVKNNSPLEKILSLADEVYEAEKLSPMGREGGPRTCQDFVILKVSIVLVIKKKGSPIKRPQVLCLFTSPF